jgi:hypothetical protein
MDNREELSDDDIWHRRMTACMFRRVMICYRRPEGPLQPGQQWGYPSHASYKGLIGSICGLYPANRKVYIRVDAMNCRQIQVPHQDFAFIDNSGFPVTEPGEWPSDVADMIFE